MEHVTVNKTGKTVIKTMQEKYYMGLKYWCE